MSDELKTHRFTLMLRPSEVQQIENWMFKRRIRSMGEAIRRLCQLGMTVRPEGGWKPHPNPVHHEPDDTSGVAE